jgi:hypothetical protein
MRGLDQTISTVFTAAVVLACREPPKIQSSADYHEDALMGRIVLVVPLVTSSELGDDRTGVVLSDVARFGASAAFCTQAIKEYERGRIVCANEEQSRTQPALAELERQFAHAEPIAPATLHAVQNVFQVDFALLFRPEYARSSREVSRHWIPGGSLGSDGSHNDPRHCATTNTCVTTRNNTYTTYVVSSVLVDLRTGKTLRSGTLSDHASRTVGRDLGYAEPAPAEPVLKSIMIRLGLSMLGDEQPSLPAVPVQEGV